MKAIHVFYIAVILLSVLCLLSSASNDSPQDLVLKYELSDTRNLSVHSIPGTTLWQTDVTEVVPVPVSVGDVVKWEWSADPEPIWDFTVFTRAKPFYMRSGVLNNSGTHIMEKEDYIYRFDHFSGHSVIRTDSKEVGFKWYLQLHHGEHFTKKTTLRYHIEVYEALKKTPSFQVVYAVAGIILVSYLIIRKKNREESCK